MNLERTVTSLEIAEMTGKRHDQVLRDIRNILEQLGERKSVESYFIESTYTNNQNKEQPCYLLSKKGCELFGTRMTGAKGTQFALSYIERFNEMENHIKETHLQLPSDPMEILKLTFQAQEQTNERVIAVEESLKEIKENSLITTEDKTAIDRMIRKKVHTIVKDQRLNKKSKSLLFNDLGSSLKQLFEVPHRGRIKEKDYQNAIEFISYWEPTSVTKTKIKQSEQLDFLSSLDL